MGEGDILDVSLERKQLEVVQLDTSTQLIQSRQQGDTDHRTKTAISHDTDHLVPGRIKAGTQL